MKTLLIFLLSSACAYAQIPCKEGFERLKEGNLRFVNDASLHPNRTAERREDTAEKQEPFAIIVGCSDSRVAPEILFDQGIGDLFIVRVAGNVVGPVEMASIEYSALYLHSCLIVVLGHENCGAINAVIEGKTQDIQPVAKLIEPALKQVPSNTADRLEKTVKANVTLVCEQLKKNPKLKSLLDQGKIAIQGSYYNFHSGQVEFLP